MLHVLFRLRFISDYVILNFLLAISKAKEMSGGASTSRSSRKLRRGVGKSGLRRKINLLGVRHKKVLRDNISGITKNDIRRLARRGGCYRISAGVYDQTRAALRIFLERVLMDASIFSVFFCLF